MLYLAIQMAFLLLVSALIGVAIGWWAKRVSQPSIDTLEDSIVELDKTETEMDDDVYALKNRLDKCFDENASLHRDVKTKETQLRRLNTRSESEGMPSDASSEALRDKVTALMDDLQLRDDTILALEKEIGAMKS